VTRRPRLRTVTRVPPPSDKHQTACRRHRPVTPAHSKPPSVTCTASNSDRPRLTSTTRSGRVTHGHRRIRIEAEQRAVREPRTSCSPSPSGRSSKTEQLAVMRPPEEPARQREQRAAIGHTRHGDRRDAGGCRLRADVPSETTRSSPARTCSRRSQRTPAPLWPPQAVRDARNAQVLLYVDRQARNQARKAAVSSSPSGPA